MSQVEKMRSRAGIEPSQLNSLSQELLPCNALQLLWETEGIRRCGTLRAEFCTDDGKLPWAGALSLTDLQLVLFRYFGALLGSSI